MLKPMKTTNVWYVMYAYVPGMLKCEPSCLIYQQTTHFCMKQLISIQISHQFAKTYQVGDLFFEWKKLKCKVKLLQSIIK